MTFRDVSDDNVHKDNIEWLAGEGITEGCNPPANDLYCPSAQVTRAQMATFLRRAYGVTLDDARAIIDEQLAEVTADLGALSEAFAGHGHGGTAPSYPGAFHVSTQAELISALNALDDGLGGTINLYGGKYRDVVVDVPDVTFRKVV